MGKDGAMRILSCVAMTTIAALISFGIPNAYAEEASAGNTTMGIVSVTKPVVAASADNGVAATLPATGEGSNGFLLEGACIAMTASGLCVAGAYCDARKRRGRHGK